MATVKNVSMTAPNDYATKQQAIERQRKLAELLQQQSATPDEGQMVSGWYVPPSPLKGAVKIGQAMLAAYQNKQLDDKQADLTRSASQDRMDTMQRYGDLMSGRDAIPEQVGTSDGDGFQAQAAQPAVKPDRRAALAALMESQDPTLQSFGMQQMLKEPEYDKPVTVGRSLLDPRTGKVIGTDATWADERKEAREAKEREIAMRLEDQRISREERAALQRELTQARLDGQREMRQIAASLRQSNNQPYFSPLQTAEGVMSFDHRSGGAAPVMSNGRLVVGSGSDPTLQGKITGAKQTAEEQSKRDFNMGGVTDIMNRAEAVLTGETKPTSSVVGNVVDKAAGIVGAAPSGAAEAEELKVLGGYLVSKMPRMEGPQSNYDVQNYKEMAGNVGNPNLPIERRLAALKQLRGIVSKYDKSAAPAKPNIDDLLKKYGGK